VLWLRVNTNNIVYGNLADYPDLDRLGRAIGFEYHGWFHSVPP
jgi:hypothetical protein